jgi:hypothetical protein
MVPRLWRLLNAAKNNIETITENARVNDVSRLLIESSTEVVDLFWGQL